MGEYKTLQVHSEKKCEKCSASYMPKNRQQKFCSNCAYKSTLSYNPKKTYRRRLKCKFPGCPYKFIRTKENQTECLIHVRPVIYK